VGDDITVNTWHPRWSRPEQVARLLENAAASPALRRLIDTIPAGRPASMEEVATLIARVASDEAGFITGQAIGINGASSM
jgi:2,3-dihydroxy-2,3-dihydro-p-cumate dehydrogenase